MEIYLLRHGIAIDRGTVGFDDDSKRPLTQEGRNKMRQIVQGIKTLDLSFEIVLSSPYIRAKQTASFVNKKISLSKNLFPESSPIDIINEINTKYLRYKSVLLVGHEPHLSRLVSFLLSGSSFEIDFKKGELCSLSTQTPIKPKHVALNWLLTPKQLRSIS